jgi:hypothetical protein
MTGKSQNEMRLSGFYLRKKDLTSCWLCRLFLGSDFDGIVLGFCDNIDIAERLLPGVDNIMRRVGRIVQNTSTVQW